MARVAFGIIMKAPALGFVKTRLAPPLTRIQATELHCCFVRDTCANLQQLTRVLPVDVFAVYTPAGSENIIRELVPSGFGLLLQRGDAFGERLLYAAEDLLAMGYAGAVLMDSDSPTVPTASLRSAAKELLAKGERVTIGPCADGGYYLLGLKTPHHRLFEDIAWSTNVVAEQTCRRAAEIGLPVTVLPKWYDVDDGASLQMLQSEFFNSASAPGNGYVAHHTRRYLKGILGSAGVLMSEVS